MLTTYMHSVSVFIVHICNNWKVVFLFYYVDVKRKEVNDLIFPQKYVHSKHVLQKKNYKYMWKYNINFKLQIFYVDACNKSVRTLEEIDVKQALCTSFFNRPYNLLKMILET